MSVLYWSTVRQKFSWIICICLLSISPSYGDLSEEDLDSSPDLKEPNHGRFRLVNGTQYSGRVEFFYEGEWGTICNDGWTKKEADVMCRSLGFGNGVPTSVFKGSGKILLADVRCTGNEASIVECNHNFEPHKCTNESNAGVSCEGVFNTVLNSNTPDYCTFDRGTCGYISSAGNFRWIRKSGSTGSSNTGPSADHTYGTSSGFYMYTEASSGSFGYRATLVNRFSSKWIGSLSFWYHMYGGSMGTLNVYIYVAGGTTKLVWSLKGNQGNLWQNACIHVHSQVYGILFEGIRGSSFTGDMAIDDVFISSTGCAGEEIGTICTFNKGMCGYQRIQGDDSSTDWSLISGASSGSPIHDRGNKSGNYMGIMVNRPMEGMRNYLISKPFEVRDAMKVEFYYYMSGGAIPGELKVSSKDNSTHLNSWSENDWQDYGDHGQRWNYGCMDLHPEPNKYGNMTKRILFTGITGTLTGISLALDDIKLANGSCGLGISNHVCTFDNPKLCYYKINCTAHQEYTWRRMQGSTSSLRTGPTQDASQRSGGYYLYAESSYGNVGDAVSIMFPVKATKGKYLKFNYHMYGQSMGSLHLRYLSGKTNKQVWQMSGNQGNMWKSFCTRLDKNIDAVMLVAVRGSRYTSDIAVDNVFLDTKPCPNPVNCDFDIGLCNYTISYYPSRYYQWQRVSGVDHTHGSKYYVMASSPSNMEDVSTSITTTVIEKTSNTSSLQFYYKVSGTDPGKLMVKLNRVSAMNMMDMMEPKFFRMDVEGWVMGCVDLPGNERISANFSAFSSAIYRSSIMLDDISYADYSCVVGIVDNVCTFDEPNVCGYNVSCRDASQFLWKRGQKTNSSATGPRSSHGKGSGYFMYTESSYGSPGDITDLEFPQFVTPPGHYLRFYYNMYGRDIGTLQVSIITPSGKMVKWSETGEAGNQWMKGCVILPVNESTTVVFTGIRGNGPLGDIAIDDVAVVPGSCHEPSIACDFSDEMICGYKNDSKYMNDGWVRRKSSSGYYMTVKPQSGTYGLKSPLRNLTDNCVQISYKIIGEQCELNVYTSYNDKKQLYLESLQNNDTDWQQAQFYIKKAATRLIFEAYVFVNWYSTCSVQIDKIMLSNGSCPALVCSVNSTSCNDQTKCIADSLLCDRIENCPDISDESRCPRSISCDFEDTYLCGYNYSYGGWYHAKLSNLGIPEVLLNNSAYAMHLYSGRASMMSPKETIPKACLKFYYAGGTGSSLEVIAEYDNGRNKSMWGIHFTVMTKWTIGQFELPKGSVQIEFAGDASRIGILIDNVELQNGTCGKIACPNDSFACTSNEKCILSQNKCDRVNDCDDKSDEMNCPVSLTCDVEHPYQCGYQYEPGTWTVKSGRTNVYPDLDNSIGLYSGRYFASSLTQNRSDHILYAPEKTLQTDACLTFYYSFHGSGKFEIAVNGRVRLVIKPNNINTWQKSQVKLSPGTQNITFIHKKVSPFDSMQNNILALDSIDLSNGSCGLFECEEGWRQCNQSPICIPEFKVCDHDTDCPLGDDEKNCNLTYVDVRLAGGRNIHQGVVEIYYNGKWSRSCGPLHERDATVVCRLLGYNGTARTRFTTQRSEYTRVSIREIRCKGYEDNIKKCAISSRCNPYCGCSAQATVDCSDTECESTHVPCSPFNATSNNNSTTNATRCIPKESVCDGEKDCPGGTDEESCPNCRSNEFQCLNYECIPEAERCDGSNDCKDGSDEYHCFKHDNLNLSFMMNGKYLPVCENNLKDQDIANTLCHYVGKGNATVGSIANSTSGVKFSPTADTKPAILPGFTPSLAKCIQLNLTCGRRECGTRSPNLKDPIIQYGHEAIAGEFPWQVSLHLNSRFICGGTLIGDRHVLTAAHCVRSTTNVNSYRIFVGSTLRYGGQRHSIKRIMAHKDFSMSLLRNDVAVLELISPVKISDYVRPACLPSKMWTPNTQCFTTGWGRIEDKTNPDDLMETKVILMSRNNCKQDYIYSDETTVCANHKQPNQPGCYGDSGGPLVCRNGQGYWEVLGVTSYGRSNCAGHVSSPQVYADVFTFKEWILEKMSI